MRLIAPEPPPALFTYDEGRALTIVGSATLAGTLIGAAAIIATARTVYAVKDAKRRYKRKHRNCS